MKTRRLAPTSPHQPELEARIASKTPPDLLADIELETVAEPWDYEPCSCGRPSWAFVELLLEQAVRAERGAVAWEEFTAGAELSDREKLTRLEQIEQLLRPVQPEGRRLLRVLP